MTCITNNFTMEKKEVAVKEIKTDITRKKGIYIEKWVGIGCISGEEDNQDENE